MANASGPDPGWGAVTAERTISTAPAGLIGRIAAIDARLMACRPMSRRLAVAGIAAALACACLGYVPRAYFDYSGIPVLQHLDQPPEYGTDTIADMYEAKVVLHDWRDMYTKTGVAQTPLEARTWSREASAPYPPAALLIEAAIYWLGEQIGIGFYGLILGLAVIWVLQAAWYCLRTRWYVFVLLGVCGLYFGYRFTYVQDCTYLIMLALAMTALNLARRRPGATHLLMALAIGVKVSPLFYAAGLPRMRRATAVLFIGVLAAAFVLPYFVFPNYLYIYTFQNELKGGWWQTVGGVAVSVPFALLLSYVAVRRHFDLEDWVGWALVPLAMLLAFKMNVARHLLVVLLVPDKRARRTAAAAISIAAYYLSFGLMRFNSTLPLCTALLFGILIFELRQVGWSVVADDARRLRSVVGRGFSPATWRGGPGGGAGRG